MVNQPNASFMPIGQQGVSRCKSMHILVKALKLILKSARSVGVFAWPIASAAKNAISPHRSASVSACDGVYKRSNWYENERHLPGGEE
jgi:hypothetical protein